MSDYVQHQTPSPHLNPFTVVKSKYFYNGAIADHQSSIAASNHNHFSITPSRTSNQQQQTNPYRSEVHYKSYSTNDNPHPPTQKQPNYSRSYQNRKKIARKQYTKPASMSSKQAAQAISSKHTRSQQRQRADVIADYLAKVPLLGRLTREDRYALGHEFKQKIYARNEVVIRQKEPGREFFIITKGHASVLIQNQADDPAAVVATLYPGDYFGETALLTCNPRNATIQANNNALHCLVLDKDTFISVFGKERVAVQFGKRGAVSAETLIQSMPHRPPSRTETAIIKDSRTKDLIASAIENNVLFAALNEDQISRIVEEMWSLNVKQGDNIIQQGEQGDNFYVVERGTFHIYVDKAGTLKRVATRSSGESFGELALMYNTTRSATVTATTDSKVWAVDRYMFRKILIKVSEQKLKEYEAFLKSVPLLDSLLVNERRAVAEALNEVSYNQGDLIVEQGSIGDTFFIIKKGEASVYKSVPLTAPATQVATLKAGSFFGERALVKNQRRAATVKVTSFKMTCLTLDREAFCLLLGPLAELMHRKINQDYDHILHSSTSNTTQSQQQTMHQSSQNSSSFVNHVLEEKHNTLTSHNLVPKPQKERISRSDLKVIGILGRGSFGAVDLVSHTSETTGETNTYALKTVSKSQIVRTGQQKHIISEKTVMKMLDFPFIVKLYDTYKSDTFLYFLLEVVLGGELFTLLRSRTVFDESTARFYTASVVLAIDYMHSKNVVYRDLKPENLLLDSRGFLKVTDFGFAKVITDRTYTLCGTPDYISPETISGAGHGFGVDWWTAGVLLFEMLASFPPFYHEDPMKTYAKIMYGQVNYPKHFSKNAVDLIRSFLHAKPTKRIGIIKGGVRNIRNHKWFVRAKFDWDALLEKRMQAPIVPVIKDNLDRSNFEAPMAADEHDDDSYIDDGTGWDDAF